MGYPWSACSFARLFAFFNRTKHNVIIVFIVVVSCGSSQPCHKYDYTLKEKTKRQNKRLLCERVCVHLFVMCASCIFFFYFLFFCIFVMFLWFFSGVSLGFVVKFSILHVSFMSFFKGFFFLRLVWLSSVWIDMYAIAFNAFIITILKMQKAPTETAF